MPEYREVSLSDLQAYLDCYDKGTIIEFDRIKSGLANSNYRLVTETGTYLLKICEEKPIESLEIQILALDSLKKNLFPSAYPYPLKVPDGNQKYLKIGEPCAFLFEFIEGKTGESYKVTPNMATSLGHVCSQLHTIPVEEAFIKADARFTLADEMMEYLNTMDTSDPFYSHSFVEIMRSKKEKFQKLLTTELPMAYVHGDIFADNCIFDPNGVVNALIDFEEICYAPALVDVSMTILGCFYKEDSTLDENLTQKFLDGYNEVRPLTPLELELLADFVDMCSIISAFWRFRQFNIRHPHLGFQERYLELLERSTSNSFTIFYDKIKGSLLHHPEPITYESTRGEVKGVSFEQAIMAGYASDGGLFMPSKYPVITPVMLKGFKSGGYVDIMKSILSKFIGDQIPLDDLEQILDSSFKSFTHHEVVPVTQVDDYYIMEMFWGPTGAFKDLSLIVLEKIINYFATKQSKKVNILVGTSGDTGSAAIHGCKGSSNINIIVLYPEGRVSKTQELQINTHDDDNVHVYSVEGTSDDLDVPIKGILNDKAFCEKHNVISTNSINLGRVLIQAVHFFYGYVHCLKGNDIGRSRVSFSIPTGACGNLCGGFIAKKMGLPIDLISGVNENDIVHRTVQTGIFSTGKVVSTSSPSMDIQVPYNWERICYLISLNDHQSVRDFMNQFDQFKSAEMKEGWVKIIQQALNTHTSGCEDVISIIKSTYEKHQYILDPHTAVGVLALKHYQPYFSQPMICLSTATPHKFSEYIQEQLKVPIPNPPSFVSDIQTRKPKFERLVQGQDWESILRKKIEQWS